MHPNRPRRHLRPLVVLLAGAALVLGMTACSGEDLASPGSCVQHSGTDSEGVPEYESADCVEPAMRVLERHDDTSLECATVPGVTEEYTDYNAGYELCLGDLDTDPATAVNVARAGECLVGVDGGSGGPSTDVQRIGCADPAAEYLVLSREENAVTIGNTGGCSDVPGTSTSYSWTLENPRAPVQGLGVDVLFCLGPAGVDPQTSPDAAQIGDCLRETGDGAGYARVDCAAPDAAYRVADRMDSTLLGMEMACSSVPDATSAIQRGSGPLDGYTLCLAPR